MTLEINGYPLHTKAECSEQYTPQHSFFWQPSTAYILGLHDNCIRILKQGSKNNGREIMTEGLNIPHGKQLE